MSATMALKRSLEYLYNNNKHKMNYLHDVVIFTWDINQFSKESSKKCGFWGFQKGFQRLDLVTLCLNPSTHIYPYSKRA